MRIVAQLHQRGCYFVTFHFKLFENIGSTNSTMHQIWTQRCIEITIFLEYHNYIAQYNCLTLYSCTVLHCTFNVYLDFCEYVCLCVNVCVCFLYNVYVFAHLYRIYQLHFAGECLMCIVAVTTYRADTLDLASVSFQPAMRIVTMVPLLFLPKKIFKVLIFTIFVFAE